MKHCSLCRLTKPVAEFAKCAKSGDGRQAYCKQCSRVKNAEYRRINREILNGGHRERASRERDLRKIASADWAKRNRSLVAQQAAKRRAATRNATPKWANMFFIKEAYRLAEMRTILTGIDWHVDHIVPLSSSRVCGLHCEYNLAVIPAKVNIFKSNRHWPDMSI